MDKQAIIRKLLSASQMEPVAGGASYSGGAAWLGQPSGVGQQVNEALQAWLERGDQEAILGAISLLRTVSLLTAIEADELERAVRAL